MEFTDITFLVVVGILMLVTTIAVFIWKGLVWVSLLSAVFWFLMGFFFIQRTQDGVELLMYQEYIQLLMIAGGFAMLFSPMWLKAKDMDLESTPDDINIFGDKQEMSEFEASKSYNRDRIDKMKSLRRNRYGQ
jgi:hypothetical protein